MPKRRLIILKVIAAIFIIFAFNYLLGALLNHVNILLTHKQIFAVFFSANLTRTIIALVILFTGIGILFLKPWSYYSALLIPAIGILNIAWDLWFFGQQYYQTLDLFALLSIGSFLYLFFSHKETGEIFSLNRGDKITIKCFPKVLTSLLAIIGIIYLASIILWLRHANLRYKSLPGLNNKPQKTVYTVEDIEFISKNCKLYEIFGYNIALPVNLEVTMIYKSAEFGWEIVLSDKDGADMSTTIFLNSKGAGYLESLRKALNFNSLYELEKNLNYPTKTPIFLILRTAGDLKEKQVEEVFTHNWRGFVKTDYTKNQAKYMMDCSLHSQDDEKTMAMIIFVRNNILTSTQAKTLVASTSFVEEHKSDATFFKQGLNALAQKDYTSATFNFLNALYYSDKNSTYAYYLALALLENDHPTGKKLRLNSSRNFLIYSLNIKPNDILSQDLLKQVNDRLNKQ